MEGQHAFVRQRPDLKQANERIWFEKWVKDGYNVQQLADDLAPHSPAKLWRIINYWLDREPPPLDPAFFQAINYAVFDGKYLDGHRLSLLTLVDAASHKPLASRVARGETRKATLPWLENLQAAGLKLQAVTTDGKSNIIKAFQEVWPSITTQRCHFHIKLQVNSWCRRRPKTQTAIDLKRLIAQLKHANQPRKARQWRHKYWRLVYEHQDTIAGLDSNHPVEGDIIRAYSLIRHALPNMFWHLGDKNIKRTTNSCEGYFKKVQRAQGFDHPGLTKDRLVKFMAWKIYFDHQ